MMKYRVKKICDIDEQLLAETYSHLSEDQHTYIGCKREDKQKQSLAARAVLGELIGISKLCYLNTDSSGKPYLFGGTPYISLSHSGEYVVAAVSDSPVGIDIQCYKPMIDSHMKRLCSEEEAEYLKTQPRSEFFRLWTAKEAYIKCFEVLFFDVRGKSFLHPSAEYDLTFEQNDDYALTVIEKN